MFLEVSACGSGLLFERNEQTLTGRFQATEFMAVEANT